MMLSVKSATKIFSQKGEIVKVLDELDMNVETGSM